jgi:hypothetical protein
MDRETPDRRPARDERTGKAAAAERMRDQAKYVELTIKQAVEAGEFDNLPRSGKPIDDLVRDQDPDWWLRKLVEREKVTGVLPPALQLRKDDAELDDRLDRLGVEREVRAELEEFNERVRKAIYQPFGGPPMITKQRDVDTEVARWRARRAERHTRLRAQREAEAASEAKTEGATAPRRRWFRR